MKAELFDALMAYREAKSPVAMVTRLEGGEQALVSVDGTEGPLALTDQLVVEARTRMRDDRSGISTDGAHFVHVHNPPLRMIVVGAVHISQMLAPMAALAGYAVTIVDPRASFATEDRFPGVDLSDDWPDEALEALKPDSRTAIVTLTHDPKLDDPALQVALKSDAFYIACLGSKRTHARRLERLREDGFSDRDFARLHGPAGLDIGAVSPAEIAISVLAEMTAVKHGAEPLKAAA
ncbi:XdhC family protein [Nisaea acidiphila]|uniref:XdhC family protein n=1 Tax=Nisaea acidiphila TaxID=1862145 RepID=A0A9J7ASN3_9PROT|nr:XdhC family protein [Nisaea acidiphila]UUX50287.1 XdhC family protein [Nisaea acidiphila]